MGKSLDLGSNVSDVDNQNHNNWYNSTFKDKNYASPNGFRLTEDSLLFFCDIDVIFSSKFLANCQKNSIARKQVYFPILFSGYDPSKSSYNLEMDSENFHFSFKSDDQKSKDLPLTIKESTGIWREYGYGLACMYQSDLISAGSFDTSMQGWGMEDVDLYSKFVARGSIDNESGNKIQIFRAKDVELQHIFHSQNCQDKGFQVQEKYEMCMKSKSALYGSKIGLFSEWNSNNNNN